MPRHCKILSMSSNFSIPYLGDGDTSIRAGFQDGALEMLDKWACERETYYSKKRDDDHRIFIPRYQESALSMALLVELGNIPHIVEEEEKIRMYC